MLTSLSFPSDRHMFQAKRRTSPLGRLQLACLMPYRSLDTERIAVLGITTTEELLSPTQGYVHYLGYPYSTFLSPDQRGAKHATLD